jgi:deoxycytidine triphosphate deaminase
MLSDKHIKERLVSFYSLVGHDTSFEKALKSIKTGNIPEYLRKAAVDDRRIVIDPYPQDLDNALGSCSLDLGLGSTIYRPTYSSQLEVREGMKMPKILDLEEMIGSDDFLERVPLEENGYALQPGEFVLAETAEAVLLPIDLCGMIIPRSRVARAGIISIGAPKIDAGFYGPIALEITNISKHTIKITAGAVICQITFTVLSSPAERPYFSRNGGGIFSGGAIVGSVTASKSK